jgi:phosphoglycerate dehydrogenase-like enzyme
MHVLVHNRTRIASGVCFVPLRFLLAHSDYVVICVRSVPETQALIHHGNVGAAKPGSVLVNISRAGIVVDEAVIQATRTGRIRRYVYELDDIGGPADGQTYHPTHPPGAIATPHVAWFTAEAAERRRQRLLSNVEGLAAQLARGH